jgi:predicted DCC family thiol-disulfide oxidoreductase YuxK
MLISMNMNNIVFYDSDCGLCQRSIRFLISLDKNKRLLFAPLNGQTYLSILGKRSDLNTVVFLSGGRLSIKSDAIISVMEVLGGWKRLVIIIKIIPRFLRDFVYDLIAGRRRKVSCVILVKDSRFLL